MIKSIDVRWIFISLLECMYEYIIVERHSYSYVLFDSWASSNMILTIRPYLCFHCFQSYDTIIIMWRETKKWFLYSGNYLTLYHWMCRPTKYCHTQIFIKYAYNFYRLKLAQAICSFEYPQPPKPSIVLQFNID